MKNNLRVKKSNFCHKRIVYNSRTASSIGLKFDKKVEQLDACARYKLHKTLSS